MPGDTAGRNTIIFRPRPGVADGPAEAFFYLSPDVWCNWSACWTHRAGSARTRPPACHMTLARLLGAEKRANIGRQKSVSCSVFQNREKTQSGWWALKGQTHLYRAVQVSRKAILNKKGGEIEHCQKQCFELSIVRAVTHQQPWHIFYRLARITENAVKAVQQIHPVVQLTLLWTQSIFGNKTK